MSEHSFIKDIAVARPAKKKAKIDEAARVLFAAKGLAATTVKDIAARARVAEGALYRHYKGKTDMARKLFRREVKAFTPRLEEILFAGGGSFEERMRKAIQYMYRYYRDQPDRFAFIMLAQYEFPRERVLETEYDPNELAIRFVKEGIRSGQLRGGNSQVLAAVLMGAVLRPLVMHRRGRLKMRPMTLARKVADTCAGMLQKSPSTLKEARRKFMKRA